MVLLLPWVTRTGRWSARLEIGWIAYILWKEASTLADLFEGYTDEASEPVVEPDSETKKRIGLSKKERKIFKALAKALKRRNKLLKQEMKQRKAEEAAVATVDKRKHDRGVKGFLKNLGDAICKAIPKVLTTLTTLAFGYFFKAKFAGKALQAA